VEGVERRATWGGDGGGRGWVGFARSGVEEARGSSLLPSFLVFFRTFSFSRDV
jgi:hypothetical protein